MFKKILICIIVISFTILPFYSFPVEASEFTPGFIITDIELRDFTSMALIDIKTFLMSKSGALKKMAFKDTDGTIRPAAEIIHQIYAVGPSLLAPVKAAMSLQKTCGPVARRPFLPLNQSQMAKLQELMDCFAEIDPSSRHSRE